MDELQLQRLKSSSISHCNKLINDVRKDHEDIHTFFSGELCKIYKNATEQAMEKAQSVRSKLRNL